MPYIVRAFPLIRPVEEVKQFFAVLASSQREQTTRFYSEYGVSHESAHLQETPTGHLLPVVTVVNQDHASVALRYAAASQEFHAWFKSQVLHLTGVDPNMTPLGPHTSELFSWSPTVGAKAASEEHRAT